MPDYSLRIIDQENLRNQYIKKKKQITDLQITRLSQLLILNMEENVFEKEVFSINHKHVLRGWKKINPELLKEIPSKKLPVFIKYVFEKSKDELQIFQMQENTDFMEMIEVYKQQTLMQNDKFTLEEAVKLLNWAIGDDGEQQEQQSEKNQENQNEKAKVEELKQKQQMQKLKIQRQVNKRQAEKRQAQKRQAQKRQAQKRQAQKKQAQKIQAQKRQAQKKQTQKRQAQKKQAQKKQEQKQMLLKKIRIKKQAQIKQSIIKIQAQKLQKQRKQAINKQISTKQVQKKQSQVKLVNQNLKKQKKTGEIQIAQSRNGNLQIVNKQKTQITHSISQNDHQQAEEISKPQQNQKRNSYRKKNRMSKIAQNRKASLNATKKSTQDQSSLDWGKVQRPFQQKQKKQLYEKLNGHSKEQQLQNLNKLSVSAKSKSPLNLYKNQISLQIPAQTNSLSISQQIDKINNIKNDSGIKILPYKPVPALTAQSDGPQMNYIKNAKLAIKVKKPKPRYTPQNGLKELYKFYCQLNSQSQMSKNIQDSQKGTFDQLQKKSNQLYLHNFMLLCKDFDLIQSRLPSNPSAIKARVSQYNKSKQNGQYQRNNRIESNKLYDSNQHKKQKKNETQEKQYIKKQANNKDLLRNWDRDRLSNYFKKQADYSLHLSYQKFIELMRIILEKRLADVNSQIQSNKKTLNDQPNNQQPQSTPSQQQQSQPQISQQKIAQKKLWKQISQNFYLQMFFKIQDQYMFNQTLKRLKVHHKMLQPASKSPQRKIIEPLSGHFQQSITDEIKYRQKQRQLKRVKAKQKYWDKYSRPEVDIYSSFKKATDSVNNHNSLYGLGPKLQHSKRKYATQKNNQSDGSFLKQSQVQYRQQGDLSRSRQYAQPGSIIRQARNQLQKQNYSEQHPSQVSYLMKNRLAPPNDNLNRTLGYKKLDNLRAKKMEEKTIRYAQDGSISMGNTNLSQQKQSKSRVRTNISSPMLQRMGCSQNDDLLNMYLEQESSVYKFIR